MTEKSLKISAGIPLILTIVERNKVKKVKLKMKPITIPIGRLIPVVSIEDDKTTGKIGRMQGESIVTIPAKKAKAISKIINYLIFSRSSFS